MKIMNVTKDKLQNLIYGFLAIAAVAIATGCSNDDDDNGDDIISDKVVASASYTLDLSYTEDQLALFDISAEYTSPKGEKVTEPITKEWSKTVKFDAFPSTFTLVVTQKLKEGVELTKESYKIGSKKIETVKVLYADGREAYNKLSGSDNNPAYSLGADKIEQYAEKKREDHNISFTISLNEDKSNVVITNN